MTFPTALLLPNVFYGCSNLATLFYSHWRGDHSRVTERLLETITSKRREQAIIPNLMYLVSAWASFFQTSAQIEKFSCGQHMHFESAPKLRLLGQYRYQAFIMQEWMLPVHSYIHRMWGLLAELAAFLPREKK